jgi:hypothetical protein
MSLPPLVNLPLSEALPIGSPSLADVKHMNKSIKNDADLLGMMDELKANYEISSWIIASAGGKHKIKGKNKIQWLQELHDTWDKEKRFKKRGFLYVAFQIWTPGLVKHGFLDIDTWNKQKEEGAALLRTLDKYTITYGWLSDSRKNDLIRIDPIYLSSL